MQWSESLRAECPGVEKVIYVDMARSNVIPTSVQRVMDAFWQEVREGANDKRRWLATNESVRRSVADLIDAPPRQIAFMKNTAEGINVVAQGIDWRAGDNCVVNDQEHPNNLLPWLNLRRRGVEVRVVKARRYRVDVGDMLAKVDGRTRAVAVSFVQYGSGFRIDLATLGRECRRRGVRLVADGIQGIGTLRFSATELGVDAVACGAHKALLGPYGVGFLYCSADFLRDLCPAYLGASPVVELEGPAREAFRVADPRDARRFEFGTLNYAGIAGLGQGMQLIRQAGIERIEERALTLARRLAEGLRGLEYSVISPDGPGEQSGLVAVSVPTPADFHDYLQRAGIRASLMSVGVVRFSPWAWNLDGEIGRILDVANAYRRGAPAA